MWPFTTPTRSLQNETQLAVAEPATPVEAEAMMRCHYIARISRDIDLDEMERVAAKIGWVALHNQMALRCPLYHDPPLYDPSRPVNPGPVTVNIHNDHRTYDNRSYDNRSYDSRTYDSSRHHNETVSVRNGKSKRRRHKK